ncbi:hypothetical protein B0H13DRAFT_1665339 [Mycena leptocephala]|nr:hypothetical protein B0H13DRAFT_1665339 [Mycena leptocephala]
MLETDPQEHAIARKKRLEVALERGSWGSSPWPVAESSSNRTLPPSSSGASIPPCPADAPEWFQLAHEAITVVSLGRPFNLLLAKWMELEATYKYRQSGKAIPAQERPKELTTWIGAGRGRRGGPNADGPKFSPESAAQYGKVWWRWWQSLQPPFRNLSERPWTRQQATVLSSSPKDWVRLRNPGPNGMFIVILGLYWWGRETAKADEKDRALWKEAISDVEWICECLIMVEEGEVEVKARALGETDIETDQLRSE